MSYSRVDVWLDRVLLSVCGTLVFGVVILGCAWGLGELRGEDAHIRMRQAERAMAEQADIKEIAEDAEIPAIVDLSEATTKRLADQFERARVAQQDHGYAPKHDIDPDSEEADASFNEYAGLTRARAERRKALKPGRILKHMAQGVASMLPWWVKLVIWGLVIYVVASTAIAVRTYLVARVRMQQIKEQSEALDQYDVAVESLDEQTRKRIGQGEALKREHKIRNDERKRALQRWIGKQMPGLAKPEPDKLNALGSDTRHRVEGEDSKDDA